jgi:hypothetical protein
MLTFREETALRLLVNFGPRDATIPPEYVAVSIKTAQQMADAMCEQWGHRGFTSCDRCGADITKKKGG